MTSAGYRPLPTNETNSAEDAARSPTMEVVVVESVDKRNILETLGQIDDVLEDAAEASLKATRSFVGDFAMFVKDGTSVETSLAILMGMVFSQLIGSMMADLLLPVVGYFIGASLVNEFVVMQPGRVGGPYFTLDEAKKDGAITLNYGQFLQQLLNFLLVTLVLYFVVKGFTAFVRRVEQSMAAIRKRGGVHHCPECCEEVKPMARRCPHCTAVIKREGDGDGDGNGAALAVSASGSRFYDIAARLRK